MAKVADFGLSMRIDPAATHVSNIYQVGLWALGLCKHMIANDCVRSLR